MNNNSVHPLRRLREKYNLTQGQLGIILDVSGTFVAQVENGFSDMPGTVFDKTCDRFNIEPQQLSNDIKDYQEQQKQYLLERIA